MPSSRRLSAITGRSLVHVDPPVVAPPTAKLVPPANGGWSGTPSAAAASDAHTGPLLKKSELRTRS